MNEVSSSQSVVEEWERDIRQSVSQMLDRSMSDFHHIFEVLHLHFPLSLISSTMRFSSFQTSIGMSILHLIDHS